MVKITNNYTEIPYWENLCKNDQECQKKLYNIKIIIQESMKNPEMIEILESYNLFQNNKFTGIVSRFKMSKNLYFNALIKPKININGSRIKNIKIKVFLVFNSLDQIGMKKQRILETMAGFIILGMKLNWPLFLYMSELSF